MIPVFAKFVVRPPPVGSFIHLSKSSNHLLNASIQNINHLVDLLGAGNQRGTESDPVRVEAAEQAVVQRPPADAHADGQLRRKAFLAGPILHELDALKQSLAANVADDADVSWPGARSPLAAARPCTRALPHRSRSRISRSTARPAAHEIGLPSKVCPSTKPGFSAIGPQKASAIGRRQIMADSGA